MAESPLRRGKLRRDRNLEFCGTFTRDCLWGQGVYFCEFGGTSMTSTGEIRRSGINVVGDRPWGTHFCNFYESKKDLLDMLLSFFKAGLEDNEFCMWVLSEPLSEQEAWDGLREAVPEFDHYR